ncbi:MULTISPECIES: ABC transporter substrate-binding protein [unclassified Meiothermus]|uniref:ABC transporter substrate-binding protein n=1 Tax=unclassified Meiothermus TaxID=370471 RepID=UPI000D7CB95B|nr:MULTISPECIES: ABC transporter substrate-binding protein [unclassified Meiothermus]PZA07329.1 sugar ABC transporter substrate-binding protein [Meiothermus sp. Pnk-1]RYM37323.1 carbohydrate ABC transporter substrate-binding protein [Meiothermus sp. PNK-Is4]
MKKYFGVLLAGLAALSPALAQNKVKLTIESWRNDDLKIWQETILPAFMKKHPNIEVVFAPSAPTEYNAVLDTKLKAGTAGDLITCRPFDKSLELFNAKYLEGLNDLPGMNNFSEVAKAAWSTDDGKTTFCVPMASVIHGFLYNKAIFRELGLTAPKTEAEFLATLQKIQASGKYSPLVMGTKDQWESATMGYQNIGPTLWKGEVGRKGLIAGTQQYNKGGFLQAFEALAKWRPFLPRGYQALAYPDAQNLFAQGRGAIYPAGSWDIGVFRQMNPKLELGAFKPYTFPNLGATQCVINDHPDIAIGLNAASKNKEAARTFLSWVASDEFAQLYANALPGFFPLANVSYTVSDPVAQEFLSWRKQCQTSFRTAYQILSRNANPNNENDLWNASAQVLNGTMTPKQAADFVQSRLASWYGPQRGK